MNALYWTLGLSVVTFCIYAVDKLAAKARGRRISERMLLTLAVLGGWPGALLSQQVFRHKTTKTSFQLKFFATATLNVIGLVLWVKYVGGVK